MNFIHRLAFLPSKQVKKTMKALWYFHDQEPWGHSIQRLVSEFPQPSMIFDPEDWIQRAASLDRYFIPTRYPNGLPDLTPGESYFAHDAESAITHASTFIGTVEKVIY